MSKYNIDHVREIISDRMDIGDDLPSKFQFCLDCIKHELADRNIYPRKHGGYIAADYIEARRRIKAMQKILKEE